MPILTKSELTVISLRTLGSIPLRNILIEARTENKSSTETSVFLSHSHTDREWVEKAIVILRKLGVRIYVDWMDSAMPTTTNAFTAQNIKAKIKENKKFILLATDAAIASKWCNWELGYGDSQKYLAHICIFPLSDASSTWSGNEYLQIYPFIEKKNSYIPSDLNFDVIFPDGTRKTIVQWLRST